jgi:hypothetical protein
MRLRLRPTALFAVLVPSAGDPANAGVATRSRFSSEDSLWRNFRRRLGVVPRDYRKHFSRPQSRTTQPSAKPS